MVTITALFGALAGCDGNESPTMRHLGPATISIESSTTTAAAPPCCARGAFTYRVWLTLRETAGVGATLSGVTVTVTETSGASVTSRISATDAFGTIRVPPEGTLVSNNISSSGPVSTVSEITVRVMFTDDNGNAGSVQTSTAARLDLVGDWYGALPIKTPTGDWSLGHASLVQSGDRLTGELVGRDGARYPLSGSVSGDWAPLLLLGGLPGTSSCASVGLVLTRFEFASGQVRLLSGYATGRCFGTVAGEFDLERAS